MLNRTQIYLRLREESEMCRKVSFFLLLTACLLPTCFQTPSLLAQEGLEKLVFTQEGELPIIISAPHGGTKKIPDVDVRKGEGMEKGASGFFTGRDSGTEELAMKVAETCEKKFGKKVYFVISSTHRKYIDYNRPPHIAFEDDDAKKVYDRYHGTLEEYCRKVQKDFGRGVLIDIHGQGTSKETVFRGTQDGKTVSLLRQRFGEEAHVGPDSFFSDLSEAGWKVDPQPLSGKERNGFRGGYIVQTYGSHTEFGIDAMQLEFGADYRNETAREKTAEVLVQVLEGYGEHYLGLKKSKPTE